MATGVLLLDDKRILVAANEAAADVLGTTREELLGRRADEFMPVVARALYPFAWMGFLLRGQAAGDYAARRDDGSLARLVYVGFANRPFKGLHFFVIEPLSGELPADALVPRMQSDYLQVGLDVPDDVRRRLEGEADYHERQLPIQREGRRSVLAALFETPEQALNALEHVRPLGVASIATAAGTTRDTSTTLLAGRFEYGQLGNAVATIRRGGGRIISHLDERWL